MAFSRSGLVRLGGANSDAGAAWLYKSSADAAAAINTAGYFNDASAELKVGDFMFICDSSNVHVVSYVASNAAGVVDIVDGTTISATDTD
jgi:hypothetical protein